MLKRITLRHCLLILAIFLTAGLNAFADGPEVQISDKLDINPNDYVVDSPTKVNSWIKATPHKDNTNYSVKVDLPNSTFVISHPTEEQMEYYRDLTEADKVKFHHKRMIGLNTLARALTSIKKGLGIGSYVKEKVMFWKQKKEQVNIAERGDHVVEGILRAFDTKAWESAPIFADLKEIGFTGTGQIVAALGTNKRIIHKEVARKKIDVVVPELKSGGAIGIGFTIGVNFEQKSVVFQLFNANEQLKEVYLPLLYLAGNLKAGMYLSSSTQKLYSSQKGEGFYPFAAPGYIESAAGKKSFGGSMAVGIPTSPIDAALSFKTNRQEQSYLKIRISPFTWKFIGVSVKNPLGIVKIAIKNIPEIFLEFKRIYQQFSYARSCKGLFI
ncbi:MAG: hypothetical protein V4654_15500 [Bdellovibrionota bacterium]